MSLGGDYGKPARARRVKHARNRRVYVLPLANIDFRTTPGAGKHHRFVSRRKRTHEQNANVKVPDKPLQAVIFFVENVGAAEALLPPALFACWHKTIFVSGYSSLQAG